MKTAKLGFWIWSAGVLVLVAQACNPGDASIPEWGVSASAATGAVPRGVYPQGARSTAQSSSQPGAIPAPPGAHLLYHGGRVISNVQIVQVLYGAGTYASFVTPGQAPNMASFYGAVTNSPYIDWLAEYNTPAAGGTNQTIGRGTFVGQFQITPSAANNVTTLTDANIRAELVAQINARNLPAPTTDAAGNNNTIYMIHFPFGKIIQAFGWASCDNAPQSFCAYHDVISATAGPGGKEIYYGVMPDMEPGSGCDFGCGANSPFGNQTQVASHELVEAITDAEISAWYDPVYSEIGDICNQIDGSVVGGDGRTYTVQTEFSNSANACIITPLSTYKLSASPLTRTAVACPGAGTVSFTMTSTLTSGTTPDTLSFSTSGFPTSGTASFSPGTISSNGGSTTARFSVLAGSTVPVPFTVTANGSIWSPSDTATVSTRYPTLICTHPPCRCPIGSRYCDGSCIPSDFCCPSLDPQVTITFAH